MIKVKGVAFNARVEMVTADFGAETWKAFFDAFRRANPAFPASVMPITLIPVDQFLTFNDAMIRELYKSDDSMHWKFGERSADFALRNHLKGLFPPGEFKRFLAFTPKVYSSYYDGGALTATLVGDQYELKISGTPPHAYFEGTVFGFCVGSLKHLGATDPTPQRVQSFADGAAEAIYRFKTTNL